MKTTITTAVAVSALFLGVASCGGNGATATHTPPGQPAGVTPTTNTTSPIA